MKARGGIIGDGMALPFHPADFPTGTFKGIRVDGPFGFARSRQRRTNRAIPRRTDIIPIGRGPPRPNRFLLTLFDTTPKIDDCIALSGRFRQLPIHKIIYYLISSIYPC